MAYTGNRGEKKWEKVWTTIFKKKRKGKRKKVKNEWGRPKRGELVRGGKPKSSKVGEQNDKEKKEERTDGKEAGGPPRPRKTGGGTKRYQWGGQLLKADNSPVILGLATKKERWGANPKRRGPCQFGFPGGLIRSRTGLRNGSEGRRRGA